MKKLLILAVLVSVYCLVGNVYSAPPVEQYRVHLGSTVPLSISSHTATYIPARQRVYIEIYAHSDNTGDVYYGFISGSTTTIHNTGSLIEPGQNWWQVRYSSGIYLVGEQDLAVQKVYITQFLKR